MNRDDITRMAREAWDRDTDPWLTYEQVFLARFAALVAAAEREACAALADAERSNVNVLLSYPEQSSAAYNIGVAIRARGQQ